MRATIVSRDNKKRDVTSQRKHFLSPTVFFFSKISKQTLLTWTMLSPLLQVDEARAFHLLVPYWRRLRRRAVRSADNLIILDDKSRYPCRGCCCRRHGTMTRGTMSWRPKTQRRNAGTRLAATGMKWEDAATGARGWENGGGYRARREEKEREISLT